MDDGKCPENQNKIGKYLDWPYKGYAPYSGLSLEREGVRSVEYLHMAFKGHVIK